VKSRGSQCNETLLVRAAVRPGSQSVCCEKLAVTAMRVLCDYIFIVNLFFIVYVYATVYGE